MLSAPILTGVPVQRLSFDLLPVGVWDMEHVVDYYRRAAENPGPALAGKIIQWERLRQLNSLNPKRCSVGREGWHGYVVFEFDWTGRVVLECPIEGNATYILSGDWKNLVGHSKLYLRTHYAERCTRVIHKGEWLARIRDALR